MQKDRVPYACHVLVCVNDRHGARKSCADGGSPALREALKEGVERRGWRGRVRVSQSGCFGLCEKGPNVILYPQGTCFHGATTEDAEAILNEVGQVLAGG